MAREAIHRTLPHGLINWRLLWPGGDARVRAHRKLWRTSLPSWPRGAWVLLQAALWLRWVAGSAWIATYRAARLHRHMARAETVPWLFHLRLLKLAICWCIPPLQAIRFGILEGSASSGHALDHVYRQETAAWHRWCNTGDPRAMPAMQLLQDKLALSHLLTGLGVPMAQVLSTVPQGSAETLAQQLARMPQAPAQLFFKTRTGSQGLGAFSLDTRDGLPWQGRTLDGVPLRGNKAVETAWQGLLAMGDALVQPLLVNHPDLAAWAPSGAAITLRLITRRQAQAPETYAPWLALLEIPDPVASGYLIGQIKLNPAQLGQAAAPLHDLGVKQTAERTELLADLQQRRAAGWTLPHVAECVNHSVQAHQALGGLWAVAWDWVITPEGPRLLEGNSGFGLESVQRVLGGLLAQPGVMPSFK